MSGKRIGAIGALLIVSFFLSLVAMLTPSWMVLYWDNKWSSNQGIVPFSGHQPAWLVICSLLMYISFTLFFPLIAIFSFAFYKSHSSSRHITRRLFQAIFALSLLISIILLVIFTVFAVKALSPPQEYVRRATTAAAGYSAYLALGASLLTSFATMISGDVICRSGSELE